MARPSRAVRRPAPRQARGWRSAHQRRRRPDAPPNRAPRAKRLPVVGPHPRSRAGRRVHLVAFGSRRRWRGPESLRRGQREPRRSPKPGVRQWPIVRPLEAPSDRPGSRSWTKEERPTWPQRLPAGWASARSGPPGLPIRAAGARRVPAPGRPARCSSPRAACGDPLLRIRRPSPRRRPLSMRRPSPAWGAAVSARDRADPQRRPLAEARASQS